jgi:hypothetical protein
VLSDGLACLRSGITAGCNHEAIDTGGKHPMTYRNSDGSTLLGNLKTSLSGTFHSFNFEKCDRRGPRWIMFPIQPSLLDGWDDRADRQCGLLLYAGNREGSQGRGGLWVIKKSIEEMADQPQYHG